MTTLSENQAGVIPTATRRLTFTAGHRVMGHDGGCRNVHGHNYEAFFTAEADGLDGLGMVIDFAVLKGCLGSWLAENWDHGFIHAWNDDEVIGALGRVAGQKTFALHANPTAENLALYLLFSVGPKVLRDTGVKLVRVKLVETENCYAEVGL